MTIPLQEFLPKFQKFHTMYVMRGTFEGTCAFLVGYQEGSGHFILKEFHSWLVRRGNGRPELFWPQLVLCEIYPDRGWPDIRYFTPQQDEEAVGVLFRLLGEFFASRNAGGVD